MVIRGGYNLNIMRAHLALTKMAAANKRESTGYMRKILAGYKKLKADERKAQANALAGEAQFLLGEQMWMDFKAVDLPSPDKVRPFQKALISLGKLLNAASREYFKVFEFKSHGWTVAAATRVGLLYHRFRDKLFNVPMPPGLTPDEEDMYRFLLDDKAFPLEEKAIEAYRRALQLAKDNLVYNDWGARAAKMLASINPETFPITGEDGVSYHHQGDVIFGAGIVAQAQAPPPDLPEAPSMPLAPGAPGATPGQPAAPGLVPAAPADQPAPAPPAGAGGGVLRSGGVQ